MKLGMRKRGDFIRYRQTMMQSAPMMCKAPSLAEGTLRCSSIKVRNGEMKEWKEELRNWKFVKIFSSGIVGSKP